MNENSITDILVTILNKKNTKSKFLFDFLMQNKNQNYSDFDRAITQYSKKDTIPDMVLFFDDDSSVSFEVKTNNADLTESELKSENRDIFLIPKNYSHKDKIPKRAKNILTWEDLFIAFDLNRSEIGSDVSDLELIRSELNIPNHSYGTNLLKSKIFLVFNMVASQNSKFLIDWDWYSKHEDDIWEGDEDHKIGDTIIPEYIPLVYQSSIWFDNEIIEISFNREEYTPKEIKALKKAGFSQPDSDDYYYLKVMKTKDFLNKSEGEIAEIIKEKFEVYFALLEEVAPKEIKKVLGK